MVKQEMLGEKIFWKKCFCRVIRTSGKNYFKAS